MSELAFLPAVELAEKIRTKAISATELLEHYLERVATYNPALNAIIHLDADGARLRAGEADDALARGENWGPLHGVPITLKESFDVTGTPSTWGQPALRDNIATRDSVLAARLRGAGAVWFGKTNVPLLLADWQSFNAVYGTTNNPWDVSRVPGGSSGGSAAALAAGLTGLEAGSDIGASIRNPAHYCGVYGHKPTSGIVPLQGHGLPGVVTPPDISVAGPLARSADDLALALDIIAGPDDINGAGWRLDLPPPRKTAIKDFKVGVMLTDINCAQESALTDQLQNTVDALARAGVQVDDKARPELDTTESHRIYLTLLRSVTQARLPQDAVEAHRAAAAKRQTDDFSYKAIVDRATVLSHRDWLAAHETRNKMRLKWAEFFTEYDLLLCPTAASTAFPHDHKGERADRTIPIDDTRESVVDQLFWAGLSGVVYLPSTVAPTGLSKSGLPCGLQMIGAHLHDHTCIEFARLMEREIGGFVAPPGYV